jgi:hypothetical protein
MGATMVYPIEKIGKIYPYGVESSFLLEKKPKRL